MDVLWRGADEGKEREADEGMEADEGRARKLEGRKSYSDSGQYCDKSPTKTCHGIVRRGKAARAATWSTISSMRQESDGKSFWRIFHKSRGHPKILTR